MYMLRMVVTPGPARGGFVGVHRFAINGNVELWLD
jgi:hypothetical protein